MKYKVWCPDYGQNVEDAIVIEAISEDFAAQLWADWYDFKSAEYCIVRGSPAAVKVQKVGEDVIYDFTVTGETVRQYTAAKVWRNSTDTYDEVAERVLRHAALFSPNPIKS